MSIISINGLIRAHTHTHNTMGSTIPHTISILLHTIIPRPQITITQWLPLIIISIHTHIE